MRKASGNTLRSSARTTRSRVVQRRREVPPPIRMLLAEHKYMARLLPLLHDQTLLVAAGDPADWTAIAQIMHYMVNAPDARHHPAEDLLFERMQTTNAETRLVSSRAGSHAIRCG